MVTRTALRYHGGKSKLAAWIISNFPEHRVYVEPFAGSAIILLRKKPAELEILNDLDGEVVNFFKVLREQPQRLIRLIELTPYARDEYFAAKLASADPVEAARRLYIRSWQQMYGSPTKDGGTWRFQRTLQRSKTIVDDWNNIDYLWSIAARLKLVQIENDDALRVIERYDSPETLFYIDPPYLWSSRSNRWRKRGYRFEMEDEDHVRLARKLSNVRGMVIVSGYPSKLYEALYQTFKRLEHMAVSSGHTRMRECLWLSPNTVEHAKQAALSI